MTVYIFLALGAGNVAAASPGFIWLDLKEAQKIAEFLGIEAPFFLATYTHKKLGRISIKEKENGGLPVFSLGKVRDLSGQASSMQIVPFLALYPFKPSQLELGRT